MFYNLRMGVVSFFQVSVVLCLLGLQITVGGVKSLGIAGYFPVELQRT